MAGLICSDGWKKNCLNLIIQGSSLEMGLYTSIEGSYNHATTIDDLTEPTFTDATYSRQPCSGFDSPTLDGLYDAVSQGNTCQWTNGTDVVTIIGCFYYDVISNQLASGGPFSTPLALQPGMTLILPVSQQTQSQF